MLCQKKNKKSVPPFQTAGTEKKKKRSITSTCNGLTRVRQRLILAI